MPLATSIDPDANLITPTATGTVGYEEFVASFEERRQNSLYRPGMNFLVDGRAASFNLTAEQMQEMVSFLESRKEERGTTGRSAVVVSREVDFGQVRMYDAYSERLAGEVMVFRNLDEARRWVLGQDEAPPIP